MIVALVAAVDFINFKYTVDPCFRNTCRRP